MVVPDIFQTPTTLIYPPFNTVIFEEYFKRYITENNIKTDVDYLPVMWTNFYISRNFGNGDMKDLQQFINSLDRKKKYFTVIQYDDGILQDLSDLDIVVFGSGGGGSLKVPDKNLGISIPLMCLPNPNINRNRDRDILCSFIGVIQGRHIIREKIRDMYQHKFVIRENMGYNNFADMMERSIFSLCPRGYGATSFRICESLQYGSIPVYVYDKPWFPWNNRFDFNDIGISVHESEIEKIEDIIKSKTSSEIDTLLKNGADIYTKFFTYKDCSDEIIKYINGGIY
jgi:hypothetical protein